MVCPSSEPPSAVTDQLCQVCIWSITHLFKVESLKQDFKTKLLKSLGEKVKVARQLLSSALVAPVPP